MLKRQNRAKLWTEKFKKIPRALERNWYNRAWSDEKTANKWSTWETLTDLSPVLWNRNRNHRDRSFLPYRNRIWHKIEYKSQKVNKERAASKNEKARFCCWKIVLNIVWIRKRSRNFIKVGTGTAIKHYGSTTLTLATYLPYSARESSFTPSHEPSWGPASESR